MTSEPTADLGPQRSSWLACDLTGSGAEPAGCTTLLPGEQPLKCVLSSTEAPAPATPLRCAEKPSWCPLMLAAWQGQGAHSGGLTLPADKQAYLAALLVNTAPRTHPNKMQGGRNLSRTHPD